MRAVCCGLMLFVAVAACAQRAWALGSTFLSGTVTAHGQPAAAATVTVSGNNTLVTTRSDAQGHFGFSGLDVGTYVVHASTPDGDASASIDLGSSGAHVDLALQGLKEIGHTAIALHVSAPPIHGSGTDLTLNQTLLSRAPAGGTFPGILLQLPGSARGANGAVHINGDHGDINYIVDGVPVPQELNRIVGSEFDPADVAYVEVLQGAYPAEYGERFASVVNISTRSGVGPPGYTAEITAGSYAHLDSLLGYHAPVGTGSLVVALRNERTERGFDPPNFDSPHNDASNANQFLRFTQPVGSDFYNLTLSHSYHTYQIPNDVANGEPANTDDNETQDDLFTALEYHHAIGDRGLLTFGPAYKRSHIRDFGDPTNDWTYGEALTLANGGTSTDCANALANPTTFGPATCAYSLSGDKTASDYRFNLDYALRSAVHEIRFGGAYDITEVSKLYAIDLQPGNFLAPVLAPANAAGPFDVVDNAPNNGHTEETYIQDSWHMGERYQLDYGLRFDAFQLGSTQFHDGASMFSPRIKLTRQFGARASAYVFYGRFFTPFSFENVSPAAAQLVNEPLQPSIAAFDLKPQRDSDYEIGGHLPLANGDLGLRVMQKNATDLIDDTQVGVTNLHQDINYQLGRIATQSLYYQHGLTHGGRSYVSFNHTYSVNKGCETQLLAPCFGSPTDWTPADHEQRWGATAGLIAIDRRGGWFSLDGEYGSGLSSASCPPGTPGFCKRTPHTTFDLQKGLALYPGTKLTLTIQNLLNDRYFVTLLNAQGNHYAAPRTIDVGLRFGER
jgi:hypothetical protein